MTREVADDFDSAWAAALATLSPGHRLVLFQDRNGPQVIQVLAPARTDEDDDTMRPVKTRLAAYPSKGLGNLTAALRGLDTPLRDPAVESTSVRAPLDGPGQLDSTAGSREGAPASGTGR